MMIDKGLMMIKQSLLIGTVVSASLIIIIDKSYQYGILHWTKRKTAMVYTYFNIELSTHILINQKYDSVENTHIFHTLIMTVYVMVVCSTLIVLTNVCKSIYDVYYSNYKS